MTSPDVLMLRCAVQLETLLGCPLAELYTGSAVSLKVIEVAREDLGGFKLRDRAEHVYSEAGRVRKFKAVCDVSGVAVYSQHGNICMRDYTSMGFASHICIWHASR